MLIVCGLRCTVCNGTYKSISSWLNHFLSDGHQIKAREASLRWGKKERKRALIAFSSCSIKNAEKLLQYFSWKEDEEEDAEGDSDGNDGDIDTIVHDFVWWPEGNKENMALLQFKNGDVVDKVIAKLEEKQLQLPEYVVQFKKASACLDLEWNQLIRKDTSTTEIIEIDDDDDDKGSECSPVPVPTPRSKKKVFVRKEAVKQEAVVKIEAATEEENKSDSDPTTSTSNSRIRIPKAHISQFQSLLDAIEIPDEEYKNYLKIIAEVRAFFDAHGYEVNMYRNFYLGLRNPGSNILLLHVYNPEQYSETGSTSQEPPKSLLRLLMQRGNKNDLLSRFQLRKVYKRDTKWDFEGMIYFNPDPMSRKSFGITHNRHRVVDVQMSRLLQYYCTFDPRVKSLLSLVYLWFLANKDIVRFGKEKEGLRKINHTSIVPEPEALNWMVILFLSQSLMKIIPTVNEILERRHPDSEIYIRGQFHDIGFNADPEFVKEWNESHPYPKEDSPEYIWSVLTLTKDFFTLLLKFLKRKWVLNPRHGEYYSQEEFIEEKMEAVLRNTKLSEKDVTNFIAKNRPVRDKAALINRHKIYVMHPFNLTWRLACNDTVEDVPEIRHLVRDTVTRLGLYLARLSDFEFEMKPGDDDDKDDCLLTALVGDKSISEFHELKDFCADIEKDQIKQVRKRNHKRKATKNSKGNPAKKQRTS